MAWEWKGFADWFEAQHGPEPPMPSVQEQVEINRAYNTAKEQVKQHAIWRQRRESALYAWQAKQSQIEAGAEVEAKE